MERKELSDQDVKRLLPPASGAVEWGFTQNGWLVWQEAGQPAKARGLAWSPSRPSTENMYQDGVKVPIDRFAVRPGTLGDGGLVSTVPASNFGKGAKRERGGEEEKVKQKGKREPKQTTLRFKRPRVQELIDRIQASLDQAVDDLRTLDSVVH